jgi:hypothetical protein
MYRRASQVSALTSCSRNLSGLSLKFLFSSPLPFNLAYSPSSRLLYSFSNSFTGFEHPSSHRCSSSPSPPFSPLSPITHYPRTHKQAVLPTFNAKHCSCWFIVQGSSEEHLYDDKNYLPHPIMEFNTDGFADELPHPRSGDATMQHTLKERRTDHNFRDLVDLIFRCFYSFPGKYQLCECSSCIASKCSAYASGQIMSMKLAENDKSCM